MQVRSTTTVLITGLALVTALGGTSYAAFELGESSVASRQIRDGSVRAVDVHDSSITRAKLRAGAVRGSTVQDGTLTGADIADGSIAPTDLAPEDGCRVGSVHLAVQVERDGGEPFIDESYHCDGESIVLTRIQAGDYLVEVPSWSQNKGSFPVISGVGPNLQAQVVNQENTSTLWIRLRNNQNAGVDGGFHLVTFTAPDDV